MDKMKLMDLYDRLCMALTNYETVSENADSCDPEYDNGKALYAEVVDIVNDMAAAIN